jgi:competence protein ComEA
MRPKRINIEEEIKNLGYKVVYVPHEAIKDYNACYNVEYKGKAIRPPAGEKLRIPLNEIWISEKFREYEEYILYHELREIEYRAVGYDGKTAHTMAEEDEVLLWKNDQKWKKMNAEMGVGREHLL